MIRNGDFFVAVIYIKTFCDFFKVSNIDQHNTSRSNNSDKNGQESNKSSIAKYTSFTGVFVDGLSVSYSTQSATPKSAKKVVLPENSPRNSTELVAANTAVQSVPASEKKPEEVVTAGGKKTMAAVVPPKKGGKKDATPEPTVKLSLHVRCFNVYAVIL